MNKLRLFGTIFDTEMNLHSNKKNIPAELYQLGVKNYTVQVKSHHCRRKYTQQYLSFMKSV